MDEFNKPNVKLPLAASYDVRGRDGFEQVVTNAREQRKVNSYYDLTVNSVTGNRSLKLTKRPGIVATGSSYSISSDSVIYLMIADPRDSAASWAACKGSSRVEVSDEIGGRVTVVSSADEPVYFDRTTLFDSSASAVGYGVLQTHDGAGSYRTWFGSNLTSWSQVSAAGFLALQHIGKIEHLDGYALQGTEDNKIYSSSLNTLVTWPTSAYIAKQIEQDSGRGIVRLDRHILFFGRETVEGFVNGGNTPNPLVRSGIAERIGLLTDPMESITPAPSSGVTHYSATIGNRCYFAGQTARSLSSANVGIFSFDGQKFERVSTPSVEKIITGNAIPFYGVFSVAFYGQQAVAVDLTGPSGTPARWLMFFPEMKEWFEWNSTVFRPVNNGMSFTGIGGTASSRLEFRFRDLGAVGNLWLDGSAGGASYDMIHQFRLPKSSNARESMAWAGVVADSQSAGASASAGAYLQISFSDNDYESFGSQRQFDLRTRRKQIYRCGSYDERDVRLTHSGNAECRIQMFIAKTL